MVCTYTSNKDDPYRSRLTIREDKLEYFGNSSSPAVSLLETISIAYRYLKKAVKDLKQSQLLHQNLGSNFTSKKAQVSHIANEVQDKDVILTDAPVWGGVFSCAPCRPRDDDAVVVVVK